MDKLLLVCYLTLLHFIFCVCDRYAVQGSDKDWGKALSERPTTAIIGGTIQIKTKSKHKGDKKESKETESSQFEELREKRKRHDGDKQKKKKKKKQVA